MADIENSLDCDPQGNHVSKKRVKRFSEDLQQGESVHFTLSISSLEKYGEKKNPSRQGLVLFTDRRVLTLLRPLTGSNEKDSISYRDIAGAELKTGLASKKAVLHCRSGELVLAITTPGKSECKDAVQFLNNLLSGNNARDGVSDKSKSFGNHSPVGDYVNQERVDKINDILDEDENVHYITRGNTMDVEGGSGQSKFGGDRGRKNSLKGYVRTAFTQKRIVIKVPQWLGDDQRTIPYRNISSINLDTGLMNKRVTLRASGGTYHIEATEPGKSECREIIGFVREKMRKSQTSDNSKSSESDPLGQLEKLKKLHDKGVVSDDEFSQKKERLLDKI